MTTYAAEILFADDDAHEHAPWQDVDLGQGQTAIAEAPTVTAKPRAHACESQPFVGAVLLPEEAHVVESLGRLRRLVAAGHGGTLHAKVEWETLLWQIRLTCGYTSEHQAQQEEAILKAIHEG